MPIQRLAEKLNCLEAVLIKQHLLFQMMHMESQMCLQNVKQALALAITEQEEMKETETKIILPPSDFSSMNDLFTRRTNEEKNGKI